MTQAHIVSPFSISEEQGESWFIWEKRTPVTSLSGKEQTDSRYENRSTTTSELQPAYISSSPVIQRRQYNTVLSRMKQAMGKAGSFSAWQN